MVDDLILYRCKPEVVSREDIPQVIPQKPTSLSQAWDEATAGMSESDKERFRQWLHKKVGGWPRNIRVEKEREAEETQ